MHSDDLFRQFFLYEELACGGAWFLSKLMWSLGVTFMEAGGMACIVAL